MFSAVSSCMAWFGLKINFLEKKQLYSNVPRESLSTPVAWEYDFSLNKYLTSNIGNFQNLPSKCTLWSRVKWTTLAFILGEKDFVLASPTSIKNFIQNHQKDVCSVLIFATRRLRISEEPLGPTKKIVPKSDRSPRICEPNIKYCICIRVSELGCSFEQTTWTLHLRHIATVFESWWFKKKVLQRSSLLFANYKLLTEKTLFGLKWISTSVYTYVRCSIWIPSDAFSIWKVILDDFVVVDILNLQCHLQLFPGCFAFKRKNQKILALLNNYQALLAKLQWNLFLKTFF